ncbi:MAG: hypothetical protein KKD68_08785, partial [Proteobacteria bacterium]|nr:hypothetical protein [Pseudomonadota bacterium]
MQVDKLCQYKISHGSTGGKPAGGYFVHRWVAQANTFYPHSPRGGYPLSLANSEYNFDINNLCRHETDSARSLLYHYRETDRQVETFEKRTICHCEETKGRRGNPLSYCIDEIASGGSHRNDCVGLLCRSAP